MKDELFPFSWNSAVLSPCRTWRYSLTRTWDRYKPGVCFVMLNPSKADEDVDDPTVRRCVGFAQSWGKGRVEIVNLFAYRATDPRDLYGEAPNIIGPDNDAHIAIALSSVLQVVVAWGNHGKKWPQRVAHVDKMITAHGGAYHLGLTRSGQPRHPVRLAAGTTLHRWKLK